MTFTGFDDIRGDLLQIGRFSDTVKISSNNEMLWFSSETAREIAAELIKMVEEIEAAEWEKTND